MVGILLVAHNGLGGSLAQCVQHVLGRMPDNLRVLPVLAEEDPQKKLAEGMALIRELDDGSGVLILTDVYGATPANIGRKLCHAGRVSGVAGVNLPMLLRVVCCGNKSLEEMADLAVEGGRECIVHMEH